VTVAANAELALVEVGVLGFGPDPDRDPPPDRSAATIGGRRWDPADDLGNQDRLGRAACRVIGREIVAFIDTITTNGESAVSRESPDSDEDAEGSSGPGRRRLAIPPRPNLAALNRPAIGKP
jgi:hypothetical protein